MCIYIYIYRERERERDRDLYIYIYIYTHNVYNDICAYMYTYKVLLLGSLGLYRAEVGVRVLPGIYLFMCHANYISNLTARI